MATIRPLEEQKGADLDSTLRQQNTKDFARQLEGNPLLGGHLLEGIEMEILGAVTTINHKLGKQIRGWILTDIISDVAAPIFLRTAWSATTLSLTASCGCTISLWVF